MDDITFSMLGYLIAILILAPIFILFVFMPVVTVLGFPIAFIVGVVQVIFGKKANINCQVPNHSLKLELESNSLTRKIWNVLNLKPRVRLETDVTVDKASQ